MPTIEIYTSPYCGYCYRAKLLLDDKGVDYTEFNVMTDPGKRQEMMARADGAHTVPQIFVGDQHLGDCEAIYQMEAAGDLDARLGLGSDGE